MRYGIEIWSPLLDHRVVEFDADGGYVGDLVPSGLGGLQQPAGLRVVGVIIARGGDEEGRGHAGLGLGVVGQPASRVEQGQAGSRGVGRERAREQRRQSCVHTSFGWSVTWIVPPGPRVTPLLCGEHATIAVRITTNPTARALSP